jgi:hypothetical protein
MRSDLSSFLLFLSSLVAVLPGNAAVVPNLDLESLCSQGDLIVVGAVADVHREGETTINIQGQSVEALSMSAELSAQKVLKGKLANPRVAFKFFIPPPSGYGGIARGQFGVFFLRESKSGPQILDPYHPYVVALPGAPGTSGACLDQVTAELAYVVASAAAPPRAKREAVEALRSLRTSAAALALTTAARDADPGTRTLAIAALLERGEMAWLDPAARILLSQERGVDAYPVWRLTTAIEGRVKDPRAIPTLVRLLHATDVVVRRAAAAALRNIGGTEAIGPLTEALGDSDDQVVWTAILGLALTTGDLHHGPGAEEEFNGKQKETYVNYWRNWAKSQR